MASPVSIYAPRGNGSARQYLNWSSGGNNSLYQGATQNTDRKRIPALDFDVHRTVTNFGRRTMMTLGRWVYANFPAPRGAVREMAEFASSTFFPQFYGKNREWGRAVEDLLEQHDKIIDMAGPNYPMRVYRRNLIISCLRDGDMLTVLVKNEKGYPFIQCIPGHRIGSPLEMRVVAGGAYDGARIIDGVIVNEFNRPVAYRVVGDNPYDYSQYVDISARDCFLSFDPVYQGQLRGFSPVGAVAYHALDISETDGFERLKQKLAASIGLVEKNPVGEAPTDVIQSDAQRANSAEGTAAVIAKETVTDSGISIRYFQSTDPNSGLDAYVCNSPTDAQQAFRHTMMRDIFAGLDWSIDFSLDPTKIGGAPDRVLIDKLNRTIAALQDIILKPACTRIDGHRVSCFMSPEQALMPFDPDWWKFDYQGPARLTADRKYDSQCNIEEEARGLKTRRKILAEAGEYIDDVDSEHDRNGKNKWQQAAADVAFVKQLGHDITIQEAFNARWTPTPNGLTPQPAAKETPDDSAAKAE